MNGCKPPYFSEEIYALVVAPFGAILCLYFIQCVIIYIWIKGGEIK